MSAMGSIPDSLLSGPKTGKADAGSRIIARSSNQKPIRPPPSGLAASSAARRATIAVGSGLSFR